MKATEIVTTIMQEQGVGQTALGKRIGVKNDTVYQRLRQDNISIDKLTAMLRALDYKVVVIPTGARVPEGGFEIDATPVQTKAKKPTIDLGKIFPEGD